MAQCLWLNEYKVNLINGGVPFELLEVEAVVVDEKERIAITPDNIELLYVMSEDVAAFEDKLRQRNKTMVSKAVTIDETDEELTKLQKQQNAILAACELKKYNPLAIPDRGKSILKIICEADHADLFDGDTSFDNAWKASKTIFRMENHASYAKRGRN